jgi:hypothetical protein
MGGLGCTGQGGVLVGEFQGRLLGSVSTFVRLGGMGFTCAWLCRRDSRASMGRSGAIAKSR